MARPVDFADILDAADQLDDGAQAELVAILSRRLAERGREQVVAAVDDARREFVKGGCQVMTAREIIAEASS